MEKWKRDALAGKFFFLFYFNSLHSPRDTDSCWTIPGPSTERAEPCAESWRGPERVEPTMELPALDLPTLDSCGRPSQYVSNIICSHVFRRIPRDTDSLATESGCGSQAVSDFTMVSRLGYCHLPCLALPLVKKRGIHFIKPDPATTRTPRRGHELPLNTQTVSWAIRTQGTTLLRNLVGHTSRYSLDSGRDTIIIFAQNVQRLKPATTVR